MKRIALLLLCLSQVHCQPASVSRPNANEDWSKRFWFDKAKRASLLGAEAFSSQEEERLLALPKDQIVDALMAKPEFSTTVLDFNLFFLGRRLENLVDERGLVDAGISSSSAVNAAVELGRDGDYFALFQWSQAFSSLQDSSYENIVQEGVPAGLGLKTPAAFRSYWIAQALKDVQVMKQLAEQPAGVRKACQLLVDENRPELYTYLLANAGLPQNLLKILAVNVQVSARCGSLGIDFDQKDPLRAQLLRELTTLETNLERLPALIADLPRGAAKTARDLFTLSYDKLSPATTVLETAFDENLWNEIPNFSTNYNRRRSAYVLKTYFCDDLTPINIVAAQEHAQSKHASDASCAACHYKLDPMAGFFRTRGISGTEFKDALDFSALVHDDFSLREGSDLQTYVDEWRAPKESSRTWNVGYIRSATKEKLNSYGESLDDLFAIIRKARESKVCLTKRMAEYLLGSDQVYDGAWIDTLAENFHKAAAEDAPQGASSAAFKTVFKSFLLSNTFAEPAIEAGQCYDFPLGAKPSNLPCAVASIIRKNCSTCHQGEGASGGLDLTSWESAEGGRFHHIDRSSGLQLSKAESMSRISARITSSDPARQMPMMRAMDTVERANLYKWISDQILGESK